MISEKDEKYIIWQNRAFRFYIASRLLYHNQQFSAAAFCANQAIDSLLKATLVYWDRSFKPEAVGHKVTGMIKTIHNKVKNWDAFNCPKYLHMDKRFQSISRYPIKGKGILIPDTFILDLDTVFCDLVSLVPFHFNSELLWALTGKNKKELNILRRNNIKIKTLRKVLKLMPGH